jgi:hypothetical protein
MTSRIPVFLASPGLLSRDQKAVFTVAKLREVPTLAVNTLVASAGAAAKSIDDFARCVALCESKEIKAPRNSQCGDRNCQELSESKEAEFLGRESGRTSARTVPSKTTKIASLARLPVRTVRTSVESPWQNGIAERWVQSCGPAGSRDRFERQPPVAAAFRLCPLLPRGTRASRTREGNAERQNSFGSLRSGPFRGTIGGPTPPLRSSRLVQINFLPVLIHTRCMRAHVPALRELRAPQGNS